MWVFLLCQNCGLYRNNDICSQKNFDTPACHNFKPLTKELTQALQKARLLAQILTSEQAEYLSWALAQKKAISKLTDEKGNPLAFGDYVKFRFGLHQYIGTIEGFNLQKNTVAIGCSIFRTPLTLHPSQIEKISATEAKDVLFTSLPDKNKKSIEWNMECLAHEILALKSKDSMNPNERKHLLICEERFHSLDDQLKFDVLIKNL